MVQVAAGGGPAAARCGAPGAAGADQVLEFAAGRVAGLGVGVVAGRAGDGGQRGGQDARGPGAGWSGAGGGGGRVRSRRSGGGGWRPGRQAWAAAVPSGFRAVTHHRVLGWRAAAAARSRASSPSRMPYPSASPGVSERPWQVVSGMVMVTRAARLGAGTGRAGTGSGAGPSEGPPGPSGPSGPLSPGPGGPGVRWRLVRGRLVLAGPRAGGGATPAGAARLSRSCSKSR